MIKWEYKREFINLANASHNSPIELMNEIGEMGWEVFSMEHDKTMPYLTMYFKRKIEYEEKS